jgi:thioredoxin-related protein
MRLVKSTLVVSALLAASIGFAQTAPTAESLMAQARTQAKAEGKNVLIIFHASWCGWCKRLDEFMAKEEFKPIFDENFVTIHLTVLERKDKMQDENPGAMEVMAWLGGKGAGLPFFGITDAEGRKIINSMRPVPGNESGLNTGFPATKEEVAYFIEIMKKAAKKVTPEQLNAIRTELSKKS